MQNITSLFSFNNLLKGSSTLMLGASLTGCFFPFNEGTVTTAEPFYAIQLQPSEPVKIECEAFGVNATTGELISYGWIGIGMARTGDTPVLTGADENIYLAVMDKHDLSSVEFSSAEEIGCWSANYTNSQMKLKMSSYSDGEWYEAPTMTQEHYECVLNDDLHNDNTSNPLWTERMAYCHLTTQGLNNQEPATVTVISQ